MARKLALTLLLLVILAGSLTSCLLFRRTTPTETPVAAVFTATATLLPPTSTPMPAPPTDTPAPTATGTLVPTPQPTATPAAPTARVTADILNARAEPNTDSEILTKLQQGTMLPVVGRNIAGDWVLITLSDGTEAWLSADWVELSVPIDSLPIKEVAPPTETPVPATPTPTPSPTSEASPTPLPAPVLLEPAHEQIFDARGPARLAWEWSGRLAADQYFVVEIAYPHEGAVWHDVHWVKEKSFTPPAYLRDLITGDRRCTWTVTVKRRTGTGADGLPTGEPVSLTSAPRAFVWGS